jgi:hypothetical protein
MYVCLEKNTSKLLSTFNFRYEKVALLYLYFYGNYTILYIIAQLN